MSVRAALTSMSLVALGAALCLLGLLVTGTLSLESTSAPESTTTVSASAGQSTPSSVESSSVESTVPTTTAATARVAGTTPRSTAPPPPEPVTAEVAAGVPDAEIAEPGPQAFTAMFDTPDDFYDRFDYGFSGQDPASNRNSDRLTSWRGDHDGSCGSPDSQRTIDIERDASDLFGGSYREFDDMFWWCREHLMTGLSTVGYSVAWFSPKPTFTDITRVCWDLNLTEVASRKWTQVLFVSETDAAQYPSSRGSGGFDLGYTNPIFQDPNGPNSNLFPEAGNLAGLQVLQRGEFRWFDNETVWSTDVGVGTPVYGNFDKATRYTHCVEQVAPGTLRFSQERPDSHGGFQQVDAPGTIPSGPVRVVFQDDNYNGPKSENHDPDFNTWHWDNIIIE